MNHVELLDCTLRDGAYLLNKQFGDDNISGIISGLVETKIDWIEMGFLQNEGFGEGKTVFRNSKDAEKYMPSTCGRSHFTAFADISRYSIENLDVCTGNLLKLSGLAFLKKKGILSQIIAVKSNRRGTNYLYSL